MYHCCFEALVFTGLRTLIILEQYLFIAASFAMFMLFFGTVFPVILRCNHCFSVVQCFITSALKLKSLIQILATEGVCMG